MKTGAETPVSEEKAHRGERDRERLEGIQMARGIAAILVVLYHAGRHFENTAAGIPLGGFFNWGRAGVDFFFTLSGFIIFYVHYADIGRPQQLRRYVWRRVSRIYPVYWVVTAWALVMLIYKSGFTGSGLSFEFVAKSLLLLPQPRDPVVPVGWTLVHEMLFYSFFAILVFHRRLGYAAFAAWMGLLVAVFFKWVTNPILAVIGSFHHLQFLMGALSAALIIRGRTPGAPYLAMAGAVGFFATGLCENAGLFVRGAELSQFLFGLASMAVIIGIANAERDGRFRPARLGSFIGAASYSIYLTHPMSLGYALRALNAVKLFPPWAMVFVMSVAAVAAGGLFYLWVERPIMKYMHRLGKTRIYGPRRVAPEQAVPAAK